MENERMEEPVIPEEIGLGTQSEELTGQSADDSAGFNERFLAYVIDTLPFVIAAYSTFALVVQKGMVPSSSEFKWKLGWIGLFIIYETIFSSGGRATIGKLVLGIRVLDNSGSPLSGPKAFLRALGYFVSSVTINLGYMIALITPGKRALHDYISGSRVVRVREKGALAEGFILVLSWALMAFFVGSWLNRTVLTFSPSEQRQITSARRTLSKMAKLEEIHFQKYGFYTNDLRRLAELTGNIPAVRKELANSFQEDSLEISTDGRNYVITAKAKNWRKTRIDVSSLSASQSQNAKP